MRNCKILAFGEGLFDKPKFNSSHDVYINIKKERLHFDTLT